MKSVVALLASIVALSATADMVANNGKDSVRLSDKPCAHQSVLTQVPAEYHSVMRHGSSVIGGVPYELCWIPTPQGAGLIFSDGDRGMVPYDHLKPASDV